MVRRWVMWAMFLSSYAPLFVLVGLRSRDSSWVITVAAGVLVLAGMLGTWLLLHVAPSKSTETYLLVEVEKHDGDVAAYAATYLLPFVTVFSADTLDVLSLAAFVAFLGVVYVRSRLIYVNPLLLLFGWHLWRVIPITDGVPEGQEAVRWPRYLLADTTRVRQGQRIKAYSVTDDLLLYDKDVSADGEGPARTPIQGSPADEDAW